MPSTYSNLIKSVGIEPKKRIKEYVVCTKCNSVYDYQSCFEVRFGKKISKHCEFVAFPNHIHRTQRTPCGALLLKEVRFQSKVQLLARKVYPYRSLKDALTLLVSRPGFLSLCEHWRERAKNIPTNTLADVYDGKVWNDFTSEKYEYFLQSSGNLVLSLNFDFFQPFTRTQYSIGALYLVILNLPRDERYKIENIILIGIIPGPKEPSLTINSYLAPLVLELQEAYKGWIITTLVDSVESTVCIRAVIGCVTCDIPASRKMCGFLSHAANMGCNKCTKEFPSTGPGSRNFAGFDRENWTMRSVESHKEHCKELFTANNKTELHNLESKYGIRFSMLIELPLFDPIRFTVIDPMHNLLLGSAKHVFSIWVEKGLLTQSNLQTLQEKSENITFPYGVGRIPLKIGSSFAGFTADQWRLWTTVLSPIVLKGILPDEDLRIWLLFVRSCTILCSRIITLSDVHEADTYLVQFCKLFQHKYGQASVTPNMHLHMHLSQCLMDYGPVHSFWCFPFERYNGLLGAYHTNRKSVETQIMNKFMKNQLVRAVSFPSTSNEFLELLQVQTEAKGSIQDTMADNFNIFSLIALAKLRVFGSCSYALSNFKEIVYAIPPIREKVFSNRKYEQLKVIYQQLYKGKSITHFSQFYHQCKRIKFSTEIIGSSKRKEGVIMAYWPRNGNSLDNIDYTSCQVGVIQFFFKHFISFDNLSEKHEHLFCYVLWKHPHIFNNNFGQSTTVTSTFNEFEDACCFMPVQRIVYRCASGEMKTTIGSITDTVFFACPISMKFCI